MKMKPDDLKVHTYIDFDIKKNDSNPEIKVGDHVKISKYKNIFVKGYTPNTSEEAFVVKNVKNTEPWTYVIEDLKGEDSAVTFCKKELQKSNQTKFDIKKVLRRKGNRLYVK